MSAQSDQSSHEFQPGESVTVAGLPGYGRVIEVLARRGRARVWLNDREWVLDLKKLTPAKVPEALEEKGGVRLVGGGSPIRYQIDLHGMRVEEALELADRALDQAVVNHLTQFKIIHGHGTGAVREAVREMLGRHPHVLRYRFGSPMEGGVACTIAIMRLPGQQAGGDGEEKGIDPDGDFRPPDIY